MMELTDEQYERIAPLLPRARGNTRLSPRQVLNGLLYMAEQGCKWRALPERFGPWHTVYMRLNRWAKAGVLERVSAALLAEQPAARDWDALSLDSTIIQLHPDASGARRRGGARRSAARAAVGRASSTRSPSTTAPSSS